MPEPPPPPPPYGGARLPPPPSPAPSSVQYVPVRTQGTSGLAIASMVLGILWLWWIGSILAVVFGHIAIGQIDRSNGQLGGKGMAIAGLVLGYLGLLTLLLVIVLAAANSS